MINPKELRIGNWILSGQYLLYHQITNGKEIDLYAHHYQPIELNGDLLQQAGFYFHPHLDVWQKTDKDSLIRLDKDFNILSATNEPTVMNVKYLHQLQNIYFALTGAELPVAFQAVYDD